MTQEVQHGADEVLRNVFWDLGQIGDKNGPKYPEAVLRRLASKILDGRAHELLAFRLCHLVRCAAFASGDGSPQGWLEFFCAPGAGRSSWAVSWLRARLPEHGDAVGPAVAASDSNVVLHYYGDAQQITISYGAMPLLAAFMEFLLNTLHYRTVRDTLAPLSKPALDWRELQDTANDLSRSVYAWLQAHRRPVQESRDFEAIARFLAAHGEQRDFAADDIDDEAVLVFWRAMSAEPASTFRTYRKTFRAFLRFAEAMRDVALEAGVDSPAPLSTNGDRGMSDIVDHSSPGVGNMRTSLAVANDWETQSEDDTSPLEEVAGAEIKFLLANEAKRLALVNAHARLLPGLAHSMLRDARFGQAQARISQDLRMKGSVTQILCTNRPEVHYDDEVAALEKLHSHLERLINAAAFVLVGGECAGEGDNVRRLDFKTLARGRSALMGLRRQGFDELRAGAPDALEVLRRTAPAIIELYNRLGPLCARLRAEDPWAARQKQDDPVFRAQFVQIYHVAEPHDGERAR